MEEHDETVSHLCAAPEYITHSVNRPTLVNRRSITVGKEVEDGLL
jgi:hypothetical protein